jgi:hypothetical protein
MIPHVTEDYMLKPIKVVVSFYDVREVKVAKLRVSVQRTKLGIVNNVHRY